MRRTASLWLLLVMTLWAAPALALTDLRDTTALTQALNDLMGVAEAGRSMRWHNPETGNGGRITALRRADQGSRSCWRFRRTFDQGGVTQSVDGTACESLPGLWQITAEDQVRAVGQGAPAAAETAAGGDPPPAARQTAAAPQTSSGGTGQQAAPRVHATLKLSWSAEDSAQEAERGDGYHEEKRMAFQGRASTDLTFDVEDYIGHTYLGTARAGTFTLQSDAEYHYGRVYSRARDLTRWSDNTVRCAADRPVSKEMSPFEDVSLFVSAQSPGHTGAKRYEISFSMLATCNGTDTVSGPWYGHGGSTTTQNELGVTLRIQGVIPEGRSSVEITEQDVTKSIWPLPYWAGRLDPRLSRVSGTLKFVVPGALAVSPDDDFKAARKNPNHPFQPATKVYTLRNTGGAPITTQVSAAERWLDLSSEGGTLAPGASLRVVVAPNPNATELVEGEKTAVVRFVNATNGKGDTSRTVTTSSDEQQRWRVFVTGYETDEMDPYWKEARRLRGAVRFNYKLRGEFTLRKKGGKWLYDGGKITIAEVKLANLYYPPDAWGVIPFVCNGCDRVAGLAGRILEGKVDGGSVRLFWGKVVPWSKVRARISVSCRPMPDCADWGVRRYESQRFFDDINFVDLTLAHGHRASKDVVSPQGDRWVQYDYLLHRLE